MKILIPLLITSSLLTTAVSQASRLVPWHSPEGVSRLSSALHKADFFQLANHFEPQSNHIYCGPTTATIVLNALRLDKKKDQLPIDSSVLTSAERKYIPKTFEPALQKYTQRNIFEVRKGPLKKKMRVLGQPDLKGKRDFGFQLRQYNHLLKAHGLKTQLQIVDQNLDSSKIRKQLVNALKTPNQYVVINYHRKALGQKGGGHISPLGAYHKASDSFLILDVNPNRAPWIWASTEDLVRAMRTKDTVENRGYILVQDIQ